MRTARSELALDFDDLKARHLQTQSIQMTRHEELEADSELAGR